MFAATNVDAHVHLQLDIVGYQFPATPDDDWCLVRASVRQGQQSFQIVDPALEAPDLLRIRDWFRALADDRLPRRAHLRFIEPCLGFELLGRDDAGVRFAVHLDLELRPPFQLEQHGDLRDDWIVEFALDAARLAAVATALDAAIARFPARAEPTRYD